MMNSPCAAGSPAVSDSFVVFVEDVFIKKNKKNVYLGRRVNSGQVVRDGIPGFLIIKIQHSSGVNPFPSGMEISRPVVNIMQRISFSIQFAESADTGSYRSGGHLEGQQDGESVQLDSAKKGGMSVGASHADGGIQGSVGTEQRPIEFEGEEIILTAPVASNPKKYDFDGQQLTGREIASKINVDNNGVAFAEGGQTHSCKCSGKQYQFGGSTVTDKDILKYLEFSSKPMDQRIVLLQQIN